MFIKRLRWCQASKKIILSVLGRVAAQMGEPDRAIAALQKLLSMPGSGAMTVVPLIPALLLLDPMFDPLRNDPRLEKLASTAPKAADVIELFSCHLRPACSFSGEMMARFARAAVLTLALTAALALNTTAIAQAPPGSLWYNGDFNYVNGLANERNTAISQAAAYDDFNVTAPLGWHVTAVFSDNLVSANVIAADWEIRTGVSEGSAGTLVASGTTNSPVVTGTGRGGFGFPELMVEVTGLNVFLPMLPSGQHYWLNVTPVGNGFGRSFNSTTSGMNCVGTPCGNDQNAFFNSTTFGTFFTSTSNEGQPYDYSNGVIGTVVPEPATAALFICGVGALLIASRRRRAV